MVVQKLPHVTLLSVTSVNIEDTHAALLHCAQSMEFGAVKMLSSASPMTTDPRVQYVRIPPLDFPGYSRFMIESLYAHVATEHCLIVQADGFILDPTRWNDEFVEYDYIGAPWQETVFTRHGPFRMDKNLVGNGGFSLRSKKLLEATSRFRFDDLDFPIKSEDVLICHYLYEEMRALGIRFAPPQLAAQFSIESGDGLFGQSFNSVFGFHGKHWLEACRAMGLPAGRAAPSIPLSRNQLCSCGSGKRFKHCHGAF